MAEAILRRLAPDRFEALSAGSHPAGFVHQLAVDALRDLEIDAAEQYSKSWDEFADVRIDVVITVCDAAAAEACPVYPGNPLRAHWPLPDPAYHPGLPEERLDFARLIARRLHSKIAALINLDWSQPRHDLDKQLNQLGEI
jgi:arsenate reductase